MYRKVTVSLNWFHNKENPDLKPQRTTSKMGHGVGIALFSDVLPG